MENKILIAYFSHKGKKYFAGNIIDLKVGNTEVIAQKLSSKIDADLFKIETAIAYPFDYEPTTVIAKKELLNKQRPVLKNKVIDIDKYNTIFLGFPNWWGTMPMAVWTFLESHDLSKKTIIPFCTHEGSGFGESKKDLKILAPNSIIKEGIAIIGSNINDAEKELKKLLDMLN